MSFILTSDTLNLFKVDYNEGRVENLKFCETVIELQSRKGWKAVQKEGRLSSRGPRED